MKSCRGNTKTILFLLSGLVTLHVTHGQAAPTTLKLTAKLRDFREQNTLGIGPMHPDFQQDKFMGCSDKGYVDSTIHTDGAIGDSTVFANDNRTPRLLRLNRLSDGKPCYNSTTLFEDWYNDRDTSVNRPFLYDLAFTQLANGMYQFKDGAFFPLDSGKAFYNLPGNNLPTFGNLQTCCAHDYGFTMEFHTKFTYLAGKNQLFNFTGDDDVWVFINGKMAIDLGGQHPPLSASVNLDTIAAGYGLKDNDSYILDFFFAERHTSSSSCTITTSLQLGNQTVATPVATPGTSAFTSQVSVSLATATPNAQIYYTLNNAIPDSNSTPYTAGTLIPVTSTTTIKAIAYRAGWLKSAVMSETYTKTFVASTLEILDELGNPFAGGYMTELNSAYTVRLTTTQAGLTQAVATGSTKTNLDQESLTLGSVSNPGDHFIFTSAAPFAFKIGSPASANNGKTEAETYDSLTVRWVNPKDANDVAVKTVAVRPSPKQARAYFSTKPDGSDTTDQYKGTEAVIYLVVIDEVLPAGVTPTVTLETTPKNGSGRNKDTESFPLTTAGPGKYIAAIPVDINPISASGDHKLQLALEDLIKATYSDPMDAESPATANAGFGTVPEIDASLQFTDKNFNALPAGIYYSPAEGALYLSYTDDWVNGQIATKTVTLTIDNDNGKAPSDAETFTIALNAAKHQGSKGVWEGSITLKDLPGITAGNHIAETYIIGKVNAKVTSHNKQGTDLTPVSDDLLVAYPNQEAQLSIEGPKGPGVQISRADGTVKVVLKDQSISSGKDTLYASVSCTESKDFLDNVMLIETSPGTYESAPISKSEGPVAADASLQCLSRDNIKVTYTDPVYQESKVIQVLLDNPVTTKVFFSPSATDSSQIESVQEGAGAYFYAVVLAHSPTVGNVDTLTLTLTTPQGEKETFPAVETAPYSEKFLTKIPFAFINGTVAVGNGTVEAKINPTDADNRVVATAAVTVDGATTKADILMIAAYDPIVKAYIRDTDNNGTGDKVYVEFQRKLTSLPASVDAAWNDSLTVKTASGAQLSFLNSDSTTVVLDFSKTPFEFGKTSIAIGQTPKATLPKDALFMGQRPAIQDSIGPIILSAEKHPSNSVNLTTGDPGFNHDTLVVTLSEPLLASGNFKEMLKFSTSCTDYADAITIEAVNSPNADGNTYTIIVDNSGKAPQAGNCIFLNTDPNKFTDVAGNPPSQMGTVLKGDDRKHIIQVIRGYPPVAGLEPGAPGYQVAVQDSRDPAKSGYANGGIIEWVAPVGFDENSVKSGNEFQGYVPSDIKSETNSNDDHTGISKLPTFISTLQIVSTSRYVASVDIFDNLGNFVKAFKQSFGYQGEMNNQNRVVPKGLVSYLVWDMKDSRGQLAGQGVYVWKVSFKFDTGKEEVQFTRTGLIRLAGK